MTMHKEQSEHTSEYVSFSIKKKFNVCKHTKDCNFYFENNLKYRVCGICNSVMSDIDR